MHPMRLVSVAVAIALAACDPTATLVTGIIQEGGTVRRALAFTVQPAGAEAGDILTPSILVAAQDSLGNTDPTFVGSVTVALGANPSGGFLDGTKTVTAVSGVASFGNLSVNKVGSGYTLVVSAPGAAPAASNAFTIVERRQ
jgi:hypothetical protein